MNQPTRLYTAVAGIFLLLQGISTLAFRLFPALDQAFPQLLSVTQMIPPHSLLHIFTGLLALGMLARGSDGPYWFALGFGLFYTALAVFGMISGHATMLGLHSFDHPFHLLLGVLGLAAAGFQRYQTKGKGATL